MASPMSAISLEAKESTKTFKSEELSSLRKISVVYADTKAIWCSAEEQAVRSAGIAHQKIRFGLFNRDIGDGRSRIITERVRLAYW